MAQKIAMCAAALLILTAHVRQIHCLNEPCANGQCQSEGEFCDTSGNKCLKLIGELCGRDTTACGGDGTCQGGRCVCSSGQPAADNIHCCSPSCDDNGAATTVGTTMAATMATTMANGDDNGDDNGVATTMRTTMAATMATTMANGDDNGDNDKSGSGAVGGCTLLLFTACVTSRLLQ